MVGAAIGIVTVVFLLLPVYLIYRVGKRDGRMEEVERWRREKSENGPT